MDKTVDFTNCKRAHMNYGGSDRKFGVIYDGRNYMLKFSEQHAKKHDVSTSYVNNVISEYISSHIAGSAGIPVHETILGTYKDEIVVGCKDFRENTHTINIEFTEYVRARYDSKDVKRSIRLDQIYETLKDPSNDIPQALQEETIKRYWDTFVIDALVGNFDRHTGSWGYLSCDNKLSLAPMYDFGSTLFPQLSDEGREKFLNDNFKLMERCLVFPSPSLTVTDEKVGKVGYYDMLASNYDPNCTKAVLNVVPKINMSTISNIIDETPFITDIQKDFYKTILDMRKTFILDRAYIRCLYHDYDMDAYNRITEGHQFSTQDLKQFIQEYESAKTLFMENENLLRKSEDPEYLQKVVFGQAPHISINVKHIKQEQINIAQEYGLKSQYIDFSQEPFAKTRINAELNR